MIDRERNLLDTLQRIQIALDAERPDYPRLLGELQGAAIGSLGHDLFIEWVRWARERYAADLPEIDEREPFAADERANYGAPR